MVLSMEMNEMNFQGLVTEKQGSKRKMISLSHLQCVDPHANDINRLIQTQIVVLFGQLAFEYKPD